MKLSERVIGSTVSYSKGTDVSTATSNRTGGLLDRSGAPNKRSTDRMAVTSMERKSVLERSLGDPVYHTVMTEIKLSENHTYKNLNEMYYMFMDRFKKLEGRQASFE